MKTPQEIFDTVMAHLRAQGEPAVNKHGQCRYRIVLVCSPDNADVTLKCAVGAIIPDNAYNDAFDDIGSVGAILGLDDEETQGDLRDDFIAALRANEIDLNDMTVVELLMVMQRYVHDGSIEAAKQEGCTWLEMVEKRAEITARRRGLIYTPPVTGNEATA